MPVLKFIGGHGSVTHLGAYLAGASGERALALDTLNIDPARAADWPEVMDATRAAFGNDSSHGLRRARTYEHVVLSPDPSDHVTLEELRALAMRWVEDNFSSYEVAVTYHDDNERRIPHAHVVINNTNLGDGRRLAPRLTARAVRRAGRTLNDIARDMGLHYFNQEHLSVADEADGGRAEVRAYVVRDVPAPDGAELAARRRGAHRPRGGARVPGRSETIGEREHRRRRGHSWKEELRDWVRVARAASSDVASFRAALEGFGVTVTDSAHGDWLFHHPSAPGSRVARGARLGRTYTRRAIERGYELGLGGLAGSTRFPVRLSGEDRERLTRSVVACGHGTRSADVSLARLARALEFNRANRVRSMSDFASIGGEEAADAADVAMRVGLFTSEARRETRRARSDAEIVLDWISERGPIPGGRVRGEPEAVGGGESPSAPAPPAPAPSRSQER